MKSTPKWSEVQFFPVWGFKKGTEPEFRREMFHEEAA